MQKIKFNENALSIVERLLNKGYDAYIVGGCVRDSLMGRKPHDWDICTSALPEQVKKVFKDYRILDTGLKHGTVTILIDDEPFEVTTFRVESDYSDGRHPDSVEFVSDIEEDLKRRDFTINAIAYNPIKGFVQPIVDGYPCPLGKDDLMKKIIRCVGNPVDRFTEDPLRILRAMRFACQLGFTIDPYTSYGMRTVKGKLSCISYERISSEMRKMIVCSSCHSIFMEYADILTEIVPEFRDCIGFQQKNHYHKYDVFDHIIHALGYCWSKDEITRFAILFHDIGKPHSYQDDENGERHFLGHPQVSDDMTRDILKRLRFDNDSISKIVELVSYHDATLVPSKKHIRRWLNKIGEEQFRRLIEIKRCDIKAHKLESYERLNVLSEVKNLLNEIIQEESCFSLKDLAVNGRDLIGIGYRPGTKIGEVLNTLLDIVMSDEVENNKELLLKIAEEMK